MAQTHREYALQQLAVETRGAAEQLRQLDLSDVADELARVSRWILAIAVDQAEQRRRSECDDVPIAGQLELPGTGRPLSAK